LEVRPGLYGKKMRWYFSAVLFQLWFFSCCCDFSVTVSVFCSFYVYFS